MVNYQYTYLIGNFLGLIVWVFLFLKRKDTRKEMLVISILFGIAGLLTQPIYLLDWWRPLTITGTAVGIEDFLFGFVIGGVAAVVYEYLFRKRIKIKKVKKIIERKRDINLLFLFFLLAGIFILSVFILRINTLIASILGFGIPTLIIYYRRKDLIKDSILSGILTLFIAIVIYNILNLITPGFFDEFWFFQNVGRVILMGVPLEEYIWYFLAGSFIGPLYEYWKEGELINMRR